MEEKLSKLLKPLMVISLIILPWQTVWIYSERFLNGYKWQYGTMQFFVVELFLWLVAIVFMFWYATKIKAHKTKFSWTKDRVFTLSAAFFVIYCFLSIFWAFDSDIALQHALRICLAFIVFIVFLLGPLNYKEIIFYFVIGSFVPVLLGIWQFFTQTTWASSIFGLSSYAVYESGTSIISSAEIGRWLRAYGSFSHPNVFAGFLVLASIANLLIIRDIFKAGKIRSLIFERANLKIKKSKAFLLIILFFQVVALLFTFSRSAWIGFILFVIGFMVLLIRKKEIVMTQILAVALFFMGLFVLIYLPIVQTRFAHSSTNEIASTVERINGYQESFSVIKQNLFLGVGAGNYTLAQYDLNQDLHGWEYQPVHNVILLVLAELGIIGFSLLLICCFLAYRVFFISSKKQNKGRFNFLLFFLAYIPILLLDHYMFSSFVGLTMSGIYWVICVKYTLLKSNFV